MARAWLQRRHGEKLGKVKFVEVMSHNCFWNVKDNINLTSGVLTITSHLMQLRIDSRSTEISGYADNEVTDR